MRNITIGELVEQVTSQARERLQRELPPPVTTEHEYLCAILLELQAANELLALLVAQGEPPVAPASDVVELREPKKRKG